MTRLLKYLFGKYTMKGCWVFLFPAVVLSLIGITGYEYGALFLYLVPALICLAQCFYPTVFVRGLFFVIFSAGSAVYCVAILSDVYRLAVGGHPSILLDVDDSVVFILFLLILLVITFALYAIRPGLPAKHEEVRANDVKET